MALVVKNPPAGAGAIESYGFDPWVGKIPWRRAWQPTLVFLPGESMDRGAWQGPWCRKESDTAEQLTHIHTNLCC